ncbi:hypothetical protein [Rhizobium sp. AAP43]|uniref:hypothetical protein n=1 Tax=Rhizobium sp. AAP43 TaxID=1523420 RepID=UPI0006B936FE|nr:hypothetical protein [Rhizobium sp. AAP43]KPF46163.1 hypothetical protein IP76_04405 [Rhizobium sp. AAP43]
MNLDRSKVQENLPKKGFVEQDDRSHIFYHFYHEGKKTHIRTHVSHGSKYKTLGDDLVSSMAKQCKTTAKNFRGLAECTLSQEGYIKLLKEAGEI